MNVTFYGHNCFVLSGDKYCLLIDPWLTKKGAFFGSWFQWPINHELISQLIKQLQNYDVVYLYISHEHQDHFDIETLKIIKPYITKCILPNYYDKFLKNNIENLGLKTKELNDLEKYKFNGKDFIQLLIVDMGINHDSTALIKINNKSFLNQNDCKIFDRLNFFSDLEINYYAVQFSGATWHPICYEIDKERKLKITRQKVLSKITAIKNALKIIKPDFYFPSAGPAIFPFLEESLSFGEDNIFIHQPKLNEFLQKQETRLIYLYPGSEFSEFDNYTPILPPSKSELLNLKSKLECIFFKYEETLDIQLLKKEIRSRLNLIKDLVYEDCPILIFKWGDNGVEIDLNKRKVKDIKFNCYCYPEKYMQISSTKSYFNLMANPNYRWQDIYLSLRAKVTRKPDIFNTFINIFLFSDKSNIKKGFETTLNIDRQRILIVNPNNGKNYEINRYCPHNGADLKEAKFDDNNNLICPRHSWKFDLENNGICSTSDLSIKANEIMNSITLCENIKVHLKEDIN